jgi:hypothetical protein
MSKKVVVRITTASGQILITGLGNGSDIPGF